VKDPSDQSIVIMPKKAYFSLIWLHGLGDTSEGFLDYFQMKASPLFKGGRIVLLQAPERAVTLN
jgi:predicted esterase